MRWSRQKHTKAVSHERLGTKLGSADGRAGLIC